MHRDVELHSWLLSVFSSAIALLPPILLFLVLEKRGGVLKGDSCQREKQKAEKRASSKWKSVRLVSKKACV